MGSVTLRSAGSTIRALRQQQHLTLEELAQRLGWDKSRLSKYENDRLGLSTEAVITIANGLGLEPLAVLVRCLRSIHPALAAPHSAASKLLDRLVGELSGE